MYFLNIILIGEYKKLFNLVKEEKLKIKLFLQFKNIHKVSNSLVEQNLLTIQLYSPIPGYIANGNLTRVSTVHCVDHTTGPSPWSTTPQVLQYLKVENY